MNEEAIHWEESVVPPSSLLRDKQLPGPLRDQPTITLTTCYTLVFQCRMPRSLGDRSGSDSAPSSEIDLPSPEIAFVVFCCAIMLFHMIRKAMKNPASGFIGFSLF